MYRQKGFSEKKRLEVYNKFDGHCAYCGYKIRYDEMVVDHIVPISKGGDSKMQNLFPSCRDCNTCKFDLSLEDFREKIYDFYGTEDFKYRILEKYYNIIPINNYSFYFERRKQNG